MDIVTESFKLYERAWKKGEDYQALLEQALVLLRQEYDSGSRQGVIVNNYAAVLLDLQMNRAALKILSENSPDSSEYCSNLAIAIAKADYDIERIRYWNKESSKYPKVKGAIIAYIDWQGM